MQENQGGNRESSACPSSHTLSAHRDLSWNAIRSIHPEAFETLRSLVKL